MLTKGGEVFQKGAGAAGGAALGIPFTSGPKQTPLSQEEAETFIRNLFEEQRKTEEKEKTELGGAEPSAAVGLPPPMRNAPRESPTAQELTGAAPKPDLSNAKTMQEREARIADFVYDNWERVYVPKLRHNETPEALEKKAEAWAQQEAGPNANPLAIFTLKTQWLMHEKERIMNRVINDEIQEHMAEHPEDWHTTPEGQDALKEIRKRAIDMGFNQPPLDVG
jgi:hypothetical protein